MTVVWASAGFILVAALVLIVAMGLPHSTAASQAMVEPGINAAAADLLQLDILPPPADAAPAFTLTDQHGQQVSLSQYRGKSVVLTFDDDECTDLCTLLAQDIVDADKDLGASAKDVVFLGVNVNPFHTGVSDVAAWSDQHGLHGSANWEFVTGSKTQDCPGGQRLSRVGERRPQDSVRWPRGGDVLHRSERPRGGNRAIRDRIGQHRALRARDGANGSRPVAIGFPHARRGTDGQGCDGHRDAQCAGSDAQTAATR